MLSSHHSRQNSPETEKISTISCSQCWTTEKQNLFESKNRQIRRYDNQSFKRYPNKISIRSSEIIYSKINYACAPSTFGVDQRQQKYFFSPMGMSQLNHCPEVKFNSCQQTLNANCFNIQQERSHRNSGQMTNADLPNPDSLKTTAQTFLRFSQNSYQQLKQPKLFKTKLNFLYNNGEKKEQAKKENLIKPQKIVNYGESIPQINLSSSNSLQQSLKLCRKRTLKNSQQLKKKSNCRRANRLASANEQIFEKLQFRHTQSIRQPEQDEDHVSIAISNSLLGSQTFERPIKQNEPGYHLSIFARQAR